MSIKVQGESFDPSERQEQGSSKRALDLFFASAETAPIYAPRFEFESKAQTGLKDLDIPDLFQGSTPEACSPTKRQLLNILKSPLIDKNHIAQREAVITALVSKREELVELVNLISELSHYEKKLFAMANSPEKGFMEIPLKETALKIHATLRMFEGEFFQEFTEEFDRLIDLIPENLDRAVFTAATDNESEKLSTFLSAVSPTTGCTEKFSGIAAFAFIVLRDKMNIPTFDEKMPEEYTDAWYFLREKSGEGHPQTLCSSPPDASLIELGGSTMAGKSFCLERDFLIRLCAQSFGYAPAGSANLHISDSFSYFTRPNPDEMGDESKFSAAVIERCEAEKLMGTRGRVYDDEPFSNTSDRFIAAWGWTRHYLEKGAKIMMATHDQELLARSKSELSAGIYHFGIQIGSNGSVTFDRMLYEGSDTSHAWEVGAALGFSENIIRIAEEYEKGGAPIITAAPPLGEIIEEPFPVELETFDRFFPNSDVLQVRNTSAGTVVSWKNYREIQMPSLARMGLSRDGCVLQVMSDGNAFTPASLERSPFSARAHRIDDSYFDRSVEDLISMCLLYSATSDPGELQSRQQLFCTLLQGDVLDSLEKATSNLSYHLSAISSAIKLGSYGIGVPFSGPFVEELVRDIGREENSPSRRALISYIGEAITGDARLYGKSQETLESAHKILTSLNELSLYEEQRLEFEEGDFNASELGAAEKVQQEAFMELAQSLAAFSSELDREEPPLEPEGIRSYLAAANDILLMQLQSELKTFYVRSFASVDRELLREETQRLHGKTEALMIQFPMSRGCAHMKMMEALTYQGNIQEEFLEALRAVDSPYFAAYRAQIEDPLKVIMNPFPDGEAATAAMSGGKVNSQQFRSTYGTWRVSYEHFIREVARLRAVISIAQTLRDEKYCQIQFHGGRDLIIEGGWLPLLPREGQVHNSTIFMDGCQVHIQVGSNKSGKSFDMRRTLWASNIGQVTGFGPAKRMYAPIQKIIALYDRVSPAKHLNLSGWGSEVRDLNKLQPLVSNPSLIGFDEVMITISPQEQSAGIAALTQVYASQGATLIHVTHALEAADALQKANPELVNIFHFKTRIRNDKTISFEHTKDKGMATANAVPLMRTMNVPAPVLYFAEEAANYART